MIPAAQPSAPFYRMTAACISLEYRPLLKTYEQADSPEAVLVYGTALLTLESLVQKLAVEFHRRDPSFKPHLFYRATLGRDRFHPSTVSTGETPDEGATQ